MASGRIVTVLGIGKMTLNGEVLEASLQRLVQGGLQAFLHILHNGHSLSRVQTINDVLLRRLTFHDGDDVCGESIGEEVNVHLARYSIGQFLLVTATAEPQSYLYPTRGVVVCAAVYAELCRPREGSFVRSDRVWIVAQRVICDLEITKLIARRLSVQSLAECGHKIARIR